MITSIDGATVSPPAHVPLFVALARQSGANGMIDIGCGAGLFGMLFRIHNSSAATSFVAGIDLYPEKCVFRAWYNMVCEGDALDVLPRVLATFPKDYHPILVAMEILEHLDRGQGEKLLAVMKASKRPAIISSPAAWYCLGKKGALPGVDHVSEWTVDDVKRVGFSVVKHHEFQDATYGTKHWMVLAF